MPQLRPRATPPAMPLTTQGGVLKYQGAEIPGNKIKLVLIAHVFENDFYEGKFDPNNMTNPVCFAVGKDEDTMKPSPDSTKPQHENCKDCKHNQFQSADTGRGKACQNRRRIAVIPADGIDNIPGAEVGIIKTPATSNKLYDAHVHLIAETHGAPPLAVVTEVSLVPDSKTQFKFKFDVVEGLPDDVDVQALFNKADAAQAELLKATYSKEDAAPAPKGKGGKPAAKTAGKPSKFAR